MASLRLLALVALVLPVALGAQQAPAPAEPTELILTNARIYTADDTRPLADAMAIRGGRVQFVGPMR